MMNESLEMDWIRRAERSNIRLCPHYLGSSHGERFCAAVINFEALERELDAKCPWRLDERDDQGRAILCPFIWAISVVGRGDPIKTINALTLTPVQRKILGILLMHPPMVTSQIAEELSMTSRQVAHQLRIMKKRGFVSYIGEKWSL